MHLSVYEEDEPDSSSNNPFPDEFYVCAAEVFGKALDALWFPEIKKPEAVELSLTFLSSNVMREQNRAFRDIDEPTDVLSFPLWEDKFPELPLGDVLICAEQVRLNAQANGVAFEDEMCLIIAHGFLHLLAFDHGEAMQIKQDEIKEKLRGCAR